MALCTQLDVEQRLQRDLTTNAPVIAGTVDGLIADAQATIEGEAGRTLESAGRVQTFDGGIFDLFLSAWPVTAVASVVEDGVTLTTDDFLFYENGRLIRMSGDRQTVWKTRKPQSIVVDYTGGFVVGTHDQELEHLGALCADVAARALIKAFEQAATSDGAAGPIQSISLEGSDTVTYATGGAFISGELRRFVALEDDEKHQLGRYKSLLVA